MRGSKRLILLGLSPCTWAPLALGLAASVGCVKPERDRSDGTQPLPAPSAPAAPPRVEPRVEPGVPGEVVELSAEALLARLRASKAKATVVNAWASWCGPCKEEFPMLVSLKAKLRPKGVEIVFISVDEPETRGAAQRFAAEHGLSGDLWVAERPLGPFKQAMSPDWPGMLPATFLFDASARLRHFWGGPVYEDELLPVIEGFLAGRPIDGKTVPGLSPGLDFREQ